MRLLAIVPAIVLLLNTHGSAWQRAGDVDPLLDRATAYVQDFVAKFSRVVAQEQYVQEYLRKSVAATGGSLEVTERRKLTSDLLLVKLPESEGWQFFRDVFEVDGDPVRNRDERLSKLFLAPGDTSTALERANQISAASAQFNVRPMGTVDNPLLALGFLQQPPRERFRFTDRGLDASSGVNARIVEFRETGRPTILRREGNRDIPANGRYWIEPSSGQVVRTEVVFSALGTETSVTTTFTRDDRIGTRVPAEMRFRRTGSVNEVRGLATYGSFRQFEVRIEEAIQK